MNALKWVRFICMGFLLMASTAAVSQRPNIVLILADDLGWGDVGYQGADDMLTPNIDRLADAGMRFTHAYSNCSVCGPSRSSLLTGRYPDRIGMWGNIGARSKAGFPKEVPLFSEMLKAVGYRTGVVGKWHFGCAKKEFWPNARGFDFFYGFTAGGHDYYDAKDSYDYPKKDFWPIHRNENFVDYKTGEYLTDCFNREALGFLDSCDPDQPFFLYLAYNAVHYPWQVPDAYLDRVDAERKIDLKYRRILAGMTLAIDDGVGAIMEKLSEKGVAENTIVIFFSDNGSPATICGRGPDGINRGKSTMSKKGPFKGYKGDTYEGGIRVPFVMKWDGVLKPGSKYDEPVMSMDIVPTLFAYMGLDAPESGFDGVDVLPYLTGKKEGHIHEKMFWRWLESYAMLKGDWKLTFNLLEVEEMNRYELLDYKTIKPRLFNLREDPSEQKNLAEQYPERLDEMLREFAEWDRQNPDDAGYFPPPKNRMK